MVLAAWPPQALSPGRARQGQSVIGLIPRGKCKSSQVRCLLGASAASLVTKVTGGSQFSVVWLFLIPSPHVMDICRYPRLSVSRHRCLIRGMRVKFSHCEPLVQRIGLQLGWVGF